MMTTAGSKGQSDFLFQETIQFCHCFVLLSSFMLKWLCLLHLSKSDSCCSFLVKYFIISLFVSCNWEKPWKRKRWCEQDRSLYSQQPPQLEKNFSPSAHCIASHLINLKIIVNKFNSRETWRHKNLILKWRCWRAGGGGCCCVLLVLMAGIFYLFNKSSGWWLRCCIVRWCPLALEGRRGEILNFMALKHCYGKWDESCVTFWRPPGAPFEASSVGMVIARHPIIRVQVFEATDGQQQSKATHNQASFPLPMDSSSKKDGG